MSWTNYFIPSRAKSSKEEVPEAAPVQKDEQHVPYTIGNDTDGNTVMKFNSNGFGMTLTLNEQGVKHLIRMLQASVSDTKTNQLNG